MPLDDRNNLNKVEELKSKLFSKNYKTQIEHRDVFSPVQKKEVADSWATDEEAIVTKEKFMMKASFFKKFFIFSVIIFILSLGYAGYIFFIGGNTVSNDNITISVLGNNFTAGGQALPLVVGITNKNNSSLELADLVTTYPKGSSNSPSDMETIRTTIGTIPAGGIVNENLEPILFGEQGSTVPMTISLEYRVPGSNAIFVKNEPYSVTINSTPINLSVNAPANVSPNQVITLDVQATLNSTTTAPGILLDVNYPAGFQFLSATPAPSFGNNVWNLGDLAPGSTHDVSISGKMIGVFNGDQKTFNISSGSQSSTDKSAIDVVFNSMQQTITIQKPFVEADLSINNVSQSEYAVDDQSTVNAQINYINNLDTKVDNLQIQAKLSGNALDPNTVNVPQGFYDSATNTITWDKTGVNALAELNPGDNGTLDFSFSPLSLVTASGGILSNPSVNIEVDVSGEQTGTGVAENNITNSSNATVNIISNVGFSDNALYGSGLFNNTGPLPPTVGKTTTYTIIWTVSNTSNSISNAQVISTLPSWVNFVGSFLPVDANLTYNSSTRQIVWNIDRIASGAGVTGAPQTVSFQVSLNPSLSQVNTTPTLLNDAVLTGHDDFANVNVSVTKSALNTDLSSDPTFTSGEGSVASN